MADRHQIFAREGDAFTVRAQDGGRGAVLGRYGIAKAENGGLVCRRIANPCQTCRGTCLVQLESPRIDHYGPGKHMTHGNCPRCGGTGLIPIALQPIPTGPGAA